MPAPNEVDDSGPGSGGCREPEGPRPALTVVSPVYRAEAFLDELVDRLARTLEGLVPSYEIILVDDGSPDGSWEKICGLASRNPAVRGILLSRNFGQHCAITAGLDRAAGEWTVVMDCDLQDQPEEIPRFLAKAREGYDVVQGRRSVRKDPALKKMMSRFFYGVLSRLTGVRQDYAVANFGIYHRGIIEALKGMREPIRYLPSMINWLGFRSTKIDVAHAPRTSGRSAYTFRRRLNLGLDVVLAYSDKPLRLMLMIGSAISGLSFLAALAIVVRAIQGKIAVLGYASLIVSIWFFSGFIIFFLGLVGLYVGKIFEGVKRRPVYVVSRTTRDE
jgi:polyisoprenyl-phosphate glycosyltransferase